MNNAYHREYNRKRYERVIADLIAFLGGKCVRCSTTQNLQFDHIDSNAKSFPVTSGWAYKWDVVLTEAKKCQLLCCKCHSKKTLETYGQVPARGTHGTLSSYRYCKCNLCKKAKSDWSREYKKRRKLM